MHQASGLRPQELTLCNLQHMTSLIVAFQGGIVRWEYILWRAWQRLGLHRPAGFWEG